MSYLLLTLMKVLVTLNPKPYTLNPKPYTLNPKPPLRPMILHSGFRVFRHMASSLRWVVQGAKIDLPIGS